MHGQGDPPVTLVLVPVHRGDSDQTYVRENLASLTVSLSQGRRGLNYGECLLGIDQATLTQPLADTPSPSNYAIHSALYTRPRQTFTSRSREVNEIESDHRESQASGTPEAAAEQKKDSCAQFHVDVMVSGCWPCPELLLIP
jgi:hypothetical protein